MNFPSGLAYGLDHWFEMNGCSILVHLQQNGPLVLRGVAEQFPKGTGQLRLGNRTAVEVSLVLDVDYHARIEILG